MFLSNIKINTNIRVVYEIINAFPPFRSQNYLWQIDIKANENAMNTFSIIKFNFTMTTTQYLPLSWVYRPLDPWLPWGSLSTSTRPHAQCQDNVTEWDVRPWCWQPGFPMGQNYIIMSPWVRTVICQYPTWYDHRCCQDIKQQTLTHYMTLDVART